MNGRGSKGKHIETAGSLSTSLPSHARPFITIWNLLLGNGLPEEEKEPVRQWTGGLFRELIFMPRNAALGW